MRKAFWGFAIVAVFGWAQLAGPEVRRITGTVVDGEEKPVAGMHIYHLERRFEWPETDTDGTFAIATSVPAIVLRKPGFRSQRVRLSSTPLRVVVQREERRFPACKPDQKTIGIKGWSARLRFPIVEGVNAGEQSQDIDYGFRSYRLSSKASISHGSGPMWSLGLPSSDLVWRSVSFEETLYPVEGVSEAELLNLIKDSRGELPDGTFWRTIARMGETAGYSNVTEATAKLLDKVLDGACELN